MVQRRIADRDQEVSHRHGFNRRAQLKRDASGPECVHVVRNATRRVEIAAASGRCGQVAQRAVGDAKPAALRQAELFIQAVAHSALGAPSVVPRSRHHGADHGGEAKGWLFHAVPEVTKLGRA